MKYYPRRPVKSFQDLEVYQRGLALGVRVIRRVREDSLGSEVEGSRLKGRKRRRMSGRGRGTRDEGQKTKGQENIGSGTESRRSGNFGMGAITDNLFEAVLKIPKLIAGAHSLRFGGPEQAIRMLEECLLTCNLAVVYLEEYRDIVNKKIEADFFEETIKEYLRLRGKILRLQRSWVKFMKIRREEGK